jgi:hypothetical protein
MGRPGSQPPCTHHRRNRSLGVFRLALYFVRLATLPGHGSGVWGLGLGTWSLGLHACIGKAERTQHGVSLETLFHISWWQLISIRGIRGWILWVLGVQKGLHTRVENMDMDIDIESISGLEQHRFVLRILYSYNVR